jgi:hypothetical protein
MYHGIQIRSCVCPAGLQCALQAESECTHMYASFQCEYTRMYASLHCECTRTCAGLQCECTRISMCHINTLCLQMNACIRYASLNSCYIMRCRCIMRTYICLHVPITVMLTTFIHADILTYIHCMKSHADNIYTCRHNINTQITRCNIHIQIPCCSCVNIHTQTT